MARIWDRSTNAADAGPPSKRALSRWASEIRPPGSGFVETVTVHLGDDSRITGRSIAEAVREIDGDDVIIQVGITLTGPGDHEPSAAITGLDWYDGGSFSAKVSGTSKTEVERIWQLLLSGAGLVPSDADPGGGSGDELTSETQPTSTESAAVITREARDLIEAVFTYWSAHATELGLSADMVNLGDTLVAASVDILRHEEAPPGVLRSVVHWFLRKADIAIEEAAKSIGKFTGPALAAAAAHKLGLWEELRHLAEAAADATSGR